MAQESNSISKVAIIGGGPAGCFCAYFLQEDFEVTVFDKNEPLKTLLPTGGGRCNLAHAEFDFRELAKNYPRGEKFLYSVFSRFSTSDTIDFFEKIGVKTYTQDDGRIFPVSNSSKDVREKMLKALNKVKFVTENVQQLDFNNFDAVVLASGGHAGYSLVNKEHTIIPPMPSLTGLKTNEKFPQGVSVKNVKAEMLCDDIIFTHEGFSGPLIYKISSINAKKEFPYTIYLDFCNDFDLQAELNSNPHKSIKNLISEHIPKSLAEYLLIKTEIPQETKCHMIDGKKRDKILEKLHHYEVKIIGTSAGQEVVTCGGIDLNEVDSKTMRSKINPKLYFCGEVLDIDGFCGGFNLQNCWSTAFVASEGIKSIKKRVLQ